MKEGRNNGFHVLDDFVCEAIQGPDLPAANLDNHGQNAGMAVIEEVLLEAGNQPASELTSEPKSGATARIATASPVFAEELRRKVAFGKNTCWAADLTEEQLVSVLGALGEYARSSQLVLECLDRHASELDPACDLPRAKLRLQMLSAMVNAALRQDLKE